MKTFKPCKGDVVLIHWHDAAAIAATKAAWIPLEGDVGRQDMIAAGVVVGANKHVISLSVAIDTDWDACNGYLIIPQSAIDKAEILRYAVSIPPEHRV